MIEVHHLNDSRSQRVTSSTSAASARPPRRCGRVQSEIENHLGYLDDELARRDWFVGDELSAADVQLSFAIQAGRRLYGLEKFPNLARFLDRIHARPA